MKNKTIFIIIGILIILSIIYYYVFYKKDAIIVDTIKEKVIKNNAIVIKKTKFPLQKGSTGEDVKTVQQFLNTVIIPPFAKIDIDGNFGDLTANALKRYNGKTTVSESELNDFANKVNNLNAVNMIAANPKIEPLKPQNTGVQPIINPVSIFSLIPDNII